MKSRFIRVLTFLIVSASLAVYAGCSTDDAVHETPPVDAGATDGGTSSPTDGGTTDGGVAPDDCFMNPTTHFEIINACTDAARVDKKPLLPLLLADGGLPPLM